MQVAFAWFVRGSNVMAITCASSAVAKDDAQTSAVFAANASGGMSMMARSRVSRMFCCQSLRASDASLGNSRAMF